LPDAESAGLWDISPELRQSLADSGIYVPGSEQWKLLTEDLILSTESNHVLKVVHYPAATTYSETFADFAIEITQSIPAADFREHYRYERLKNMSKVEWHGFLRSWLRRMRIFRFPERVTTESLSILRGFVDDRTPRPYIDALWDDGRIIDITITGLLELASGQRAEKTALLSMGLELFRVERDDKKVRAFLTAIMTANIPKQWGGPRRKPKDFTPETCERFAKKTQELQPLWEFITEFFETNDYVPSCIKMVRLHEMFEELSSVCNGEVPEDLLKRVFQRERKGGQEYWPRTFALMHAKVELGITNPSAVSTLHEHYYNGSKSLKERSKPNTP
jgi:hypothetical protein